MTKKIAIAPKVDSSSVGVLLATPNDVDPMIGARAWVKSFADKIGEPGVTVRSLGGMEALCATMGDILLAGKDATIAEAKLDSMFGKLRGHTLIWVAPNAGKDLALFTGADGQAVTITVADLTAMQLVTVGEMQIVLHPNGGSDNRVFQIALFMWILRLSFYTQIYLCIFANQRRPKGAKVDNREPETTDLDAIAAQINRLTGCTVYFNTAAIELDGKTAVVPSGTSLAPASGKELVSETAKTLSAPEGTFFSGSSKRV